MVLAVFDLSIFNSFSLKSHWSPWVGPWAAWGALGPFLNILWAHKDLTGAPLGDLLAPSGCPRAPPDYFLGLQGPPRTPLVTDFIAKWLRMYFQRDLASDLQAKWLQICLLIDPASDFEANCVQIHNFILTPGQRAFRRQELSRKATSAYSGSADNWRAFLLQEVSWKSTRHPPTWTQQKINGHSAYRDTAENRRTYRLQVANQRTFRLQEELNRKSARIPCLLAQCLRSTWHLIRPGVGIQEWGPAAEGEAPEYFAELADSADSLYSILTSGQFLFIFLADRLTMKLKHSFMAICDKTPSILELRATG